MMKKCYSLMVAMLAAIMLTACRDDDGARNHDYMYCDIVTVESASEADGTLFTMQRYDDSPLISYTDSKWVAPEKIVGQRVLIYYYTESDRPYESGEVKTVSVKQITNGAVAGGDPTSPQWNADAVFLNSIWRTGIYLNMRMRVSYSAKPRYFALTADETTLNSEQPQLYLVHNLDGEPQSYMSEIYASFDLSFVWDKASCRSVCVHVFDSNRPEQTYVFSKGL